MEHYLVQASSLTGYDPLVLSLGGCPDTLRRAVRLPVGELSADTWIPYHSFIELIELSAQTLNCPSFGLQLSRQQSVDILGTVGFVMREAPDLRTALIELVQYFSLHNRGAEIVLSIEQGYANLRFESRLSARHSMRQQRELVVGIGLKVMRLLCGSHWKPSAIHFSHSAPADRIPYQRLFDCALHFDAPTSCMMFPAEHLDTKITSANPNLHSILEEHARILQGCVSEKFPERVKQLIRQALITGNCSVDRVAEYLAIDKRTLQRRLKRENSCYKTLLDNVRFEVASQYLIDSGASLSTLADMLGYSDLSAFSNAFKAKTGLSPRAWRAQYVS